MKEARLKKAWEAAVAATRVRSPATFDRWFSGIQLESFTDGVLCLRAKDAFVRDWAGPLEQACSMPTRTRETFATPKTAASPCWTTVRPRDCQPGSRLP